MSEVRRCSRRDGERQLRLPRVTLTSIEHRERPSPAESNHRSAPSVLTRSRRPPQSWWVAPVLGLACFFVYNANLRQIGAGDTLPARYLPLGILRFHTLRLDPIRQWVAHGHQVSAEGDESLPRDDSATYFDPRAYWIAQLRDAHLVSRYPVVAPLLVTPLYLPAFFYLEKHHWQQPYVDRVAEAMEKISASILAALASVAMYLVLRRNLGWWAVAVALAFAFGTNTWMTSSQALWQHGAGELLIALALLLATGCLTALRAVALGTVCVAIAANRPPDAVLAGAIALYVIWTRRRSTLWLAIGAAIPLAALLLYNVSVIGRLAGGYGTVTAPLSYVFQYSWWTGIAGLLVSPARGLLTFTPFLIFVPLGLRQRFRAAETRGLAIALTAAVIAQVLLYSKMDWRAGTSWGPRYLTDMLPVLIWMLAPAVLACKTRGRLLFAGTVFASIAVQAIGAFCYTKASDDKIFASGTSLRAAWDIGNVPFLAELHHGWAGAELQCDAAGSVDRVGVTLRPDPAGPPPILTPGAAVEGWALTCCRSPAQLFLLIDGVIVGSTDQFLPRPDVDAAMGTKAASGWRVLANTDGVEPGERLLQVAVRIEPRSDIRVIRELRVKVPPPSPASAAELAATAERAASLLRDRQRPPGYWLTSYTSRTQFESPSVEMNTFLTAAMIDLLAPIEGEHNLREAVDRARRHLAAQIEENGLVRYHGLRDAPTIGTLGCVITPDCDDTALAWRITGATTDPRREQMLNELAAYRDTRGLYRTWLAPREKYQCLDPGHDPDPADATIQMHVYLMLERFDPPAAQALCGALQSSINDDDLWVYYAKAPVVPYLRSAELRHHGCDIGLPSDRLAHAEPGQELWAQAVRWLVATSESSPSVEDRQAISLLLTRIARENFAELHRRPPLLYHNDLTATVSRYYWSEDFGYALWLRLFEAVRTPAGSSSTASP